MSSQPQAPQSPDSPWHRRPWARAALALTILAGIGIRAYRLDSPPLWVDESESSINALTILEHGVPVDHYLDQPIFENTLIKPWPESEEYEFKDISYSEKGLAVYHGWLPLYSIAASMKLFGIEPDKAKQPPRVQHERSEFRRMTVIPRLPALVYSAVLLLLMYPLGRKLGGPEVGWAMLLSAAFAKKFIWLGRQARYYSPTLALSAACGLCVWNASRRGLWRDYILAGVSFALLFHAHILSFTVMGAVFAAMLPFILRQKGAIPKLAATGAIIISAALPWIIYTGFLGHQGGIPSARSSLNLMQDLLIYPLSKKAFLFPCILGAVWLAVLWRMRKRIPEAWRRPFTHRLPAFYFAAVWTVVGYAVFNAMIPAASYFVQRITMIVAVPGLLLTALFFGCAARAFAPKRLWLAPLSLLAILAATGRLNWVVPGEGANGLRHLKVVNWMREWNLPEGARVYAGPNDHLVLSYYSGIPVQSSLPVRKSWFDDPSRQFVVIEAIPHYNPLDVQVVESVSRELAWSPGLDPDQVLSRERKMRYLTVLSELHSKGVETQPPLPELDRLDRALIARAKESTKEGINEENAWIPILRDAEFETWNDAWLFFFARFVDPDSRRGDKRNFWDRARQSRAHVLPFGWVAYDCTAGNILPPFEDSSPYPSR